MTTVCLLLGWMVTSTLGPGNDDLTITELYSYDAASAGVLSDPSGFGKHPESGKRPGIIDADEGSDGLDDDDEPSIRKQKEPSVSGALADLHHAVSDKIQSWNPYFVKSQREGSGSGNRTSEATGGKNTTATFLAGESVKDGLNEDDRLGARTRIGKATILFHGNSFWERCIRTHEQHDKVHGYRLHVLRQQLMDDVWSKPAYILSLLLRELSKHESERLDWLFWVDADTVILNPYVPIETFLPPSGTEFDDVYLMYSNDWNGLNNGVFPIRVNQWAVQLFAAIVSWRHFNPEDPLQFRDQSAMNSLMQEPAFARHIVQAPQRWFNAYQGEHNETLQPFQVRRGDLLVHFAGVPAREERMQYWLERAEQHMDDWEVPVKSTSYPQEARDFWNEQKDIRKNKVAILDETRENVTKLMATTQQQLDDYGDRIDDEQKSQIAKQREELQKIVNEEKYKEDVEKMEEGMEALTETLTPLINAKADANRLLLKSAHKAIFAGEKDLLDGVFSEGSSQPELEEISISVKKLKALVMAPEEFWNRHDLAAATNVVTEARAKYQEKIAAELASQQRVQEEQEANAKLLEEAQKTAQQEADEAVAAGASEEVDTLEGLDAVDGVQASTEVDAAEEAQAVEGAEAGLEQTDSEETKNFVVVTAPGPTQWVTAVVTATSNDVASPTPVEESN